MLLPLHIFMILRHWIWGSQMTDCKKVLRLRSGVLYILLNWIEGQPCPAKIQLFSCERAGELARFWSHLLVAEAVWSRRGAIGQELKFKVLQKLTRSNSFQLCQTNRDVQPSNRSCFPMSKVCWSWTWTFLCNVQCKTYCGWISLWKGPTINYAAWLFLNRPPALDAVLRSSPLLAELGRVSRIKTGIILTTSHPPPPLIQTDPTQHPQTDTHHTNSGIAKQTRVPNGVRQSVKSVCWWKCLLLHHGPKKHLPWAKVCFIRPLSELMYWFGLIVSFNWKVLSLYRADVLL